MAHGTPGTSFNSIFEKGDYDPAKHAIVTFSTLKRIVRKWLADVYHQRPHRALGISPVEVWNSSIKPEDIRVPEDPAVLDVSLRTSPFGSNCWLWTVARHNSVHSQNQRFGCFPRQ